MELVGYISIFDVFDEALQYFEDIEALWLNLLKELKLNASLASYKLKLRGGLLTLDPKNFVFEIYGYIVY